MTYYTFCFRNRGQSSQISHTHHSQRKATKKAKTATTRCTQDTSFQDAKLSSHSLIFPLPCVRVGRTYQPCSPVYICGVVWQCELLFHRLPSSEGRAVTNCGTVSAHQTSNAGGHPTGDPRNNSARRLRADRVFVRARFGLGWQIYWHFY